MPKAFLDCAATFRRALAKPGPDRAFGCTAAYLQSLPGGSGSTRDMVLASGRAATVADLYVDATLFPEIVEGLEPEPQTDEQRVFPKLSRHFLLRSYIRSARGAGETLCDLYYDYFSKGTIRSILAGSCAVANRDKLIDDLLRFADAIETE